MGHKVVAVATVKLNSVGGLPGWMLGTRCSQAPITAHLRYHPHIQIWNPLISKHTQKLKMAPTLENQPLDFRTGEITMTPSILTYSQWLLNKTGEKLSFVKRQLKTLGELR